MANYGPAWKEHRRFALMTMRNLGLGKQSMEERILGEVSYICAHLEKFAGNDHKLQCASIQAYHIYHALCGVCCIVLLTYNAISVSVSVISSIPRAVN